MASLSKEEYTARVVQIVKAKLGTESWFKGVCCDDLDEDFNAGISPEIAAENAAALTIYWDEACPCEEPG